MIRLVSLRRFNIVLYVIAGTYIFLSTYSILFRKYERNVDECKTVLQRNAMDQIQGKWDSKIVERRQILDGHCSKDSSSLNNSAIANHILINKNSNMAMCYVPKTGCTFWKRVIYKLQTSKGEQIQDLFDIGKRKIHALPIKRLSSFKEIQHLYNFLKKATKIVFARDPYSRLFSAYVDKFFLPDFWGMGGVVKRGGKDVKETVKSCGHDVTFADFLRYVIHAEETEQYTNMYADDHWMPVARLCQPCAMDYDVIAKQETFSSDRDWILDKFNLTHVFAQGESISREDTAKDAMNQTIDTYWWAAMAKKPCVTQLELVQRFWRSFQIQGYLPSSLKFPVELLENKNGDYKEIFRSIAMENFDQHKLSREGYKKQRLLEMTTAYDDIPTEIMNKIQFRFNKDFEMFSYEKKPSYLYSRR